MFSKKISVSFLVIVMIFISSISFADDALNITRWTVDSILIDNGDLSISEDITFEFNDEFNGVYRNIVLNGTDGIKNLELYEVIKGEEIPYNHVDSAKKGNIGVFTSSEKGNSLEIMIFSPSEDETKTFRIKYTVKDLAIKHKNTGELYYKFLGDENSTPIDYFSASIKLPNSDRKNTKIFAHGPLNGNISFIEDDLIKLGVTSVPTNTFVEARILFPETFISSSTNIGNNNLDSIIDEELALIKRIEEKAIARAENKKLFNNISMGTIGLGILVFGFIFNKFRRKAHIFDSLNSLSPEEITPAELRYFYFGANDARSLMTTVFDLARKEYILIDEIPEERKKKKSEFLFTRTIKEKKDLLSHEEFLLDWLFNIVGNGNIVSTMDIEEYRNKNYTDFNKNAYEWKLNVKNNIKEKNYYDNNSKKYATVLVLISIFLFIIGIASVIFGALYGVALILVSFFVFIYGISLYFRKSDIGYVQYSLWKDFKKELNQFKEKYKEYNISIPTDRTLLYALALGLPMKSLDNFRNMVQESYSTSHWAYWYFATNQMGGSSFEDRLNSSFYGNEVGSSSSSTGVGGGFSGGGGGGAGGGGAGGF